MKFLIILTLVALIAAADLILNECGFELESLLKPKSLFRSSALSIGQLVNQEQITQVKNSINNKKK